MLVGLRVAGKTVLLNPIQEKAEEAGYQALLIEAPESKRLPALLLPPLRSMLFKLDASAKLNASVKRALRVLRNFADAVKVKVGDVEVGLDIEPERGTADSGDLEADLPDLLLTIGEAARARDTAVALIVDELQYLEEFEMSALIISMHKAAQKQLPVVLFGAGLPQLVGLSGRSKPMRKDYSIFRWLDHCRAPTRMQPCANRYALAAWTSATQRCGKSFASRGGIPIFCRNGVITPGMWRRTHRSLRCGAASYKRA